MNHFSLDAEGHCVANQTSCNPGYFYLESDQSCQRCLTGCSKCTNATECIQCDTMKGFVLNATNSSHCIQSMCPRPHYFNHTTQTCQNCSSNCSQCLNSTHCHRCEEGFDPIHEGDSVTCNRSAHWNNSGNCSEGEYYEPWSNMCQPCQQSCKSCVGLYNCTSCVSD